MAEDVNVVAGPFSDEDFKKDGGLKKAAIRRVDEEAAPRGTARSFNEVTGETTVTTTLDGQTVTFVEDGDTSDKPDVRESQRATDPPIRAMDNARNAGDTDSVGGGEGS